MASDFGASLGGIIGGALGANDLSGGQKAVNNTSDAFTGRTEPYNQFGQSFMPGADALGSKIGAAAGNVQSYEDFAKGYQTSPGVQYQLDQATQAQNESAAAKGGLLSGTNMRALSDINQGIASTGLNNAYSQYLQGNQQGFGQLTSAFGSMLGAVGVGTTATGQQAGVDAQQMKTTGDIAQAQAKNDAGKGSGFGSLFSGIASAAAMF